MDVAQWREEYRAAVCAPIFEERWPSRRADWLREQLEATAEEIAMAESLRERYEVEAKPLRDRHYDATLRAAASTGFATMVFQSSAEHAACHRALLDLHVHGRQALVRFRRSHSPVLQERVGEHWSMLTHSIAGPLPYRQFLDDEALAVLDDWPDMPIEWGW